MLVGALTGLAATEGFLFETQKWLATLFSNIAKPETPTLQFLSALNRALTLTFELDPNLAPLPPSEKRLTLAFVGFIERTAFTAMLSNFEDHNGPRGPHNYFVLTKVRATDATGSATLCFGARSAVDQARLGHLNSTLHSRSQPIPVLAAEACSLIARAATDRRSGGVIGGPTTVVTMTAAGETVVEVFETTGAKTAIAPLVLEA